MVNKLVKNKFLILILLSLVLILMFACILLLSKDEQTITASIYDININNIEKDLVTKNTVDIKPSDSIEEIVDEKIDYNATEKSKKSKVVVVNTPIIKVDDTVKNNEVVEAKQEEKNTIKLCKNEITINKMKSIILMILLSSGHFGDVGIEVDKEIVDESKEYISLENLDETMFTDITGKNIKIYAVDEYVNDKFVRTRCYVEIK